MMKAGIDDFGSGDFKGFSCVVLGAAGADDLEREGRAILSAAGLTEFHGKGFRVSQADAYEKSLCAVKRALESHGDLKKWASEHRKGSPRQFYEARIDPTTEAALGAYLPRARAG